MADFNVDDLPDLTTETAKNKPFSVDDLPDLNVKKKDVPAPKLESGSEATISSNGQSKSTSASTIVSPFAKKTAETYKPTILSTPQTQPVSKVAKSVLGTGTVMPKEPETDLRPKTGEYTDARMGVTSAPENPYDVSGATKQQSDNTDSLLPNVGTEAEAKSKAEDLQKVQKERELANPNSFQNIGTAYKQKASKLTGTNDVEKMMNYGEVIGNKDFIIGMLDDNDKAIYDTKSQIEKIDSDNKVYDQQFKAGSISQEVYDAHKKENSKKAVELNSEYVKKMQSRNSAIDDEIKQSQAKLASGVEFKQFGASTYSEPLTPKQIESEKAKIKQLTDLKQDVLIDVNNPIKSLEKHTEYQKAQEEGLIPTSATNTQKIKIYSYILADKAKKLATELGYDAKDLPSLLGKQFGSNTPKMFWESAKSLIVGSSDKEQEYIHTMAELQAIAPIAVLNKNNLTLNEGYTSNIVSSFRKSVAPMFVKNQIATDQDRNALTKEAFGQAGITDNVSKPYTTQQGNVEAESKTVGKSVSRTVGDIGGIGVKIAGINTILGIPGAAIESASGKPIFQALDKALSTSREAQALEYSKLSESVAGAKTVKDVAQISEAKKVLDIAKVVSEKLPNNFLTRTVYGTVKAGTVHEIQGRVNDELKGFANFGVGSVNHLIGMPINTLGQVAIKMFGKEAPLFVEKVIQAAQSGTAMTATMAGMTVVNAARETEDMSAFKDVLDQHFGTKEKALRFVAENFLLGLALHAVNANTVSGLFKSKYDEGYSKLSPEEKAKVDDFVKDTNEKANDFETATKDAVEQVQKDDHVPLTTDKEIDDNAKALDQATNVNIQSQDFGAEAKQDAKIESAVIEIGGKMYEGNNHAEAILKAKADGQDISQVNRQAEGKFKLSDGTIIDRAESKTRFGQDRSELMIPQDENAKEANKEYAKITRKPLSKIAEKIKLDENQVTPIKPINTGQEQNNIGGVQQTPENNQGVQQGSGIGQVSGQESPAEKVEEDIKQKYPAQSILVKDSNQNTLTEDGEMRADATIEKIIGKSEDGTDAYVKLRQSGYSLDQMERKSFINFAQDRIDGKMNKSFSDWRKNTWSKDEVKPTPEVSKPVSEVAELEGKQQKNSLSEQNGQNKQEILPLNETTTNAGVEEGSGGVGGDVGSKSILKSDVDLKGDKKKSWMRKNSLDKISVNDINEEGHNNNLSSAKENVKAGKKSQTKEAPLVEIDENGNATIIDGHHRIAEDILDGKSHIEAVVDNKFNIRDAIKDGLYEKAISEGRMTAKDAKEIIESAGLKVPKEIESLLSKEQQTNQEVKDKVVGSGVGGDVDATTKALEGLSIDESSEIARLVSKNEIKIKSTNVKDVEKLLNQKGNPKKGDILNIGGTDWEVNKINKRQIWDSTKKEFKDADGYEIQIRNSKNGETYTIRTDNNNSFKGSELSVREKLSNYEKQIAEAYHKAKADGSNPELVEAVADLIGKPTAQTPENNQGVQQIDGIGQDVSNESEVPQIQQEQEVIDKSVEKTILKKRVYDNENSKEEFKRELSKYGLNRDKIPHAEAKSIANNIIAQHGIDNAMDAVRNGDIKNGIAAEIYYAKFKQLDTQVNEAKTDEEKTALIGQKAKLVSDWSNAGTDAGQFNSQLANIYKEDDGLLFNAEIQKEEYKSLNGGTISPEMEKKFDDLSNQLEENKKIIDDLNSKQTEIEEKYKDAVSQKDVDAAIKDAYEKGKKDGTKDSQSKKYTKRFNEIADNFERKFKSKPLILKDADGNEIQLTQNSIVSWNDIVKVGSEAIRKTGQIADGVSAIIDHIKDQEWYKDLSPKSRDAVKNQFADYFKDSKKDDGFSISGKTVKDIILRRKSENENTTIEDVVEEINRDFPDKTPREIRDAISGYGKVKEATGGIDAEVRKIKRMGRYLSALEDIENGIRPKRSGQQRDTTDPEERAKLREIREELKKLPLSDADLSQKLKTAQDAIETRLNNEIEDLQREIDTGEKRIRTSNNIQTTKDIEDLKAKRDAKKQERDDLFQSSKYDDVLQELKDIADKTGQKTITKTETKNGLISDLLQAHIEKGTEMKDVQKQMFDDLQAIFPDITQREVLDAIAKKGVFKADDKEKTDLQKKLSELKKQLNYQTKIEDIQKGIIAETKKNGDSEKAKELRKQLSDAKKEAANTYPEVSANELQKKIEKVQKSIDNYKAKEANKDYFIEKKIQAEFHKDKDWRKNYKELEAKKLEREKIKAEFERKKDKAADKHRTNTEKIGEFLGKLKRFDIFLDIFGMGRLALAAVFRPAFLPLRETSKYLLSRVATETMKKSPGNYRSSIGQSLRYVSDYYASYFAKKTYKDAWSEFDKRSNFSLEHDAQNGKDRYSTLAGKILAAPEQAHGFMKAFAKLPQFNATYKAALENLNQTIDPQTGEVYDINDPAVQQMAVHEAKREANADVLMADSDLARLNSALWTGAMKSDNYIVQLTGIIGKQLEPVIKVPINFYHEVLDQIPLVGLADAISTIARSGDIKEKQTGGYRGVKNLTHDQAHDVQRKLTNQLVGVMSIGIGMGLYKLLKEKSEDDLKEVEKWMHNSSFPIVMMGMELAKDLEHKNYDKISDIPADVIKKQTQHLPQYKVMKDIVFANDKTFKKLLAALVTPAFLRKWALMQDNEKKRYPKSIQDYIAVNFPQIKIGGKVIIEGRQGVSRGTTSGTDSRGSDSRTTAR